MRAWTIVGGGRLGGRVEVGGSKYSALAAIPALALAEGPCVLHHVPDIVDARAYVDMFASCGAAIRWEGASLYFDPRGLQRRPLSQQWAASLRASTYMLAVQLVLWGEAEVGLPGGDRLGSRPLDLHIKALRALGAEVELEAGGTLIRARARRLQGAPVYLDQPSVGATVQVLLAAVRAEGETRIDNAYVAPFIVDLASLLRAMGAEIHGAGTSHIRIVGRSALHPVEHCLIGDQAEAFTFLALAAATGSTVRVEGIEAAHLASGLAKLEEAGARWETGAGWVTLFGPPRLRAVDVRTGPLPAFYTDYQPPLAAALATASGVSRIVETVWPERFSYAEGLRAMGADVRVEGNQAVIRGGRLRGARLHACESRAAAAYAIAAVAAADESYITGVEHLDRVCEHFVTKLQALGAGIVETAIHAAEVPEQAAVSGERLHLQA